MEFKHDSLERQDCKGIGNIHYSRRGWILAGVGLPARTSMDVYLSNSVWQAIQLFLRCQPDRGDAVMAGNRCDQRAFQQLFSFSTL